MKIFIALAVFSLSMSSFAAKNCNIGGQTIQSGSHGCEGGSQVSCNNGVVTFDSDSNGNAIPCGGIASPKGAMKVKAIRTKN